MNKPWKTLIIDDEPLARERLKRLLDVHRDTFRIEGEAFDGDQAKEMIESLKPDIIFLDVQMPGKNVFTMLSEIGHKPFIVFCTAFDHYALEAFQSLSIDYLVKPVEDLHLLRVINKLETITDHISSSSLKSVLDAINRMEPKKEPTSITHKSGDKTILVKLEKVVYMEADNKYVNFYNGEGTKFLSDQSLRNLEEKLPAYFIRVSKSVILNRNLIGEVHKYFRGRMIFVMHDIKKTRIVSGGAYLENVRKCLESLN